MFSMKISSLSLLIFIIAASAMTPWAEGACSVGGCGGYYGSWTASTQAFMNWDVPFVGAVADQNIKSSSFSSGSFQTGQPVGETINKIVNSTTLISAASTSSVYVAPGSRVDLFPAPGMLKSLDAVSEKDVVMDVSSSRSPGEAHIRGAEHIPAKSFFYENGTLRKSGTGSDFGRGGHL